MRHILRPLIGFETWPRFDNRPFKRFPVRFLRYWFMRTLLEDLYSELRRPLSVLEVGIGGGRMLAFMDGPPREGGYDLPNLVSRWDGLDVKSDPASLTRYSYSGYIERDVEGDFSLPHKYDAVILLHVLEHLFDPEAAMRRLLGFVNYNGILIGGSPTMPTFIATIHERRLRAKNSNKLVTSHRHLSAITKRRIVRFSGENNLRIDLLTGAFFARLGEHPVENSKTWVRANLAWGALFPTLGGELYFSLRKTPPP